MLFNPFRGHFDFEIACTGTIARRAASCHAYRYADRARAGSCQALVERFRLPKSCALQFDQFYPVLLRIGHSDGAHVFQRVWILAVVAHIAKQECLEINLAMRGKRKRGCRLDAAAVAEYTQAHTATFFPSRFFLYSSSFEYT